MLQKVSNAQGMLDAERAAGNLTELEFLSKLSNLNAGAISDLRQRAEIYESISNSIGGAAGEKARVQAEALRVEVARLAAGTNLVGREFEKIAESAFADFLTDVATGAKTAKEAFLDMEKAIVASVSRIAAQNLAEKLFGGSASGGTTTGNNWLDLLLSIGLRFLGVNTGGGLGYGTAGSVIPPGPYPYANGTAFHPGGWAMVGERGPELLQLPRGSAVVPNHQLAKMGGSSVTVHQTINVQGTVDGRTARQIAREAALSLNTAMSRG